MEEVRVFAIPATPESLRGAMSGQADDDLIRRLQHLATDITARASGGPLSLYVCSTDADKAIRDYLAVALARSIAGRLPNALVVDCDFLAPGLSGIVPNPDALGLLDLVLYGSSLGVITQRAASGVAVIGAGSFDASRRMPFLVRAFDDAARYLCRPAGCVMFTGPALDDKGAVHPIAARVGLPVVVESGLALRNASPLSSQVAAAKGSLVWSLRVPPVVSVAATSEAPPTPAQAEPEVDEVLSHAMAPIEGAVDRDAAEASDEPGPPARGAGDVPYREETLEERSGSSALPKIVTTMLAIFVIGFLLWWLYLTKSMREGGEPPMVAVGSAETGHGDSSAVEHGVTQTRVAAPDSLVSAPPLEGAGGRVDNAPDTVPETQPLQVSRPDAAPKPEAPRVERDVAVPDLAEYAGKYLVHVSSFHGRAKAQEDADYLTGRGYEAVIAQVDLGDKGIWYRVYVGPFATPREAGAMKIRLDENPRVGSTRITKVPGQATATD
jgi:cell division septation protein DedD